MYQPVHFREERLEILHEAIEHNPFGLLISSGMPDEAPMADGAPFLLDRTEGKLGGLRVHLARANPHWQVLGAHPERKVLVVFQGPQAYVTPSWYETKGQTGKVVPTWNYVMVQVEGRVIVREDAGWLRSQVAALTSHHETRRPEPWAVTDAPEDYIAAQLKAIVGLEIDITSISGKWKVSQNRPEADRAGVAAGMAGEARNMALLVGGGS